MEQLFTNVLLKAQAAVNLDDTNDIKDAKLHYEQVISQLQEICANTELSDDQRAIAKKQVRRTL